MPLAALDSLRVFSEGALLISAALVLAVLGRLVAERIAIPIAAVLLLAAATFSDVFSGVARTISLGAHIDVPPSQGGGTLRQKWGSDN